MTSALGERLTRAHRARQLAVRAQALRQVLTIWPAFNLDDIDQSWSAIEVALVALVGSSWEQSADIARRYYDTFRDVERAPGPAPVAQAEPIPTDSVVSNLRLLGPISAKKMIERRTPNVEAVTLTRVSGSVGRMALLGGRSTISALLGADRAAIGYRRITDGSPCNFCADQANKGIDGENVDFPAHDHCGCSQEPAFRT